MREIKRREGLINRYVNKLYALTEAHAAGNDEEFLAAVSSIRGIPIVADVLWHGRRRGDPWPEDAPWGAESDWAEAALSYENSGMPLGHACSHIMLMEQERGNGRPLAQWLKAGWAPEPFVLQHLAGVFSEEDAYVNGLGEPQIAKKGKGPKIGVANRNHKIGLTVSNYMKKHGPGSFEAAVSQVAEDFFGVGERDKKLETVRKAYEKFLSYTRPQNAKAKRKGQG